MSLFRSGIKGYCPMSTVYIIIVPHLILLSEFVLDTFPFKVQQELEAAKKRVAKLKTELKSRGLKSSLPPSYSYLVINR